jgi:hypothetical protein
MKGLYYLEAIIACVLIAGTLLLFIYRSPPSPQLSKLNYKLDAFNGLKVLDESGELRADALAKNVESIKNKLVPYIRVNYEVTLFNETHNITSIPSIDSAEVVTVSYFIAGDIGNYFPLEIRVYLWGFE